MPGFKRERPTIGVLPAWSPMIGNAPDRYLSSVLDGVQTAAHLRRCHLLVAWGVRQEMMDANQFPAWPVVSPDSDYVPVGPGNTDGLIVLAPLRDPRRSAYLERLSRDGFPVLYVATGEIGPTIASGNANGIRQAVAHLHEEHGHQRIAFIAGDPLDKGDSESRLLGYRNAVAEFSLVDDPRLTVTGMHTNAGGYDAFKQLRDSGVEFSAVVVSDDNSAIGAMRAMREAGIRIPADLAVVGFDDQPEAMAQVPPLASVHVPLQEMGQQAVVMMHDHLTSNLPLESIQIPTRLVPRHSCGCMPAAVLSAADRQSQPEVEVPAGETRAARAEWIKEHVVTEMLAALPAESRLPEEEQTRAMCRGLVDSFYASLQEGDPARFQAAMFDLLLTSELQDVNMDLWQEMISILRRWMSELPLQWRQARTRGLAENLLHQARAAISDSVQRRDQRHQFQSEQKAHQLGLLASRLSTTLDEQQVIAVLNMDLSRIGIRRAYVAVFEREADDPVAWSVMPGYDPDSPLRRFRTREFPPHGLVSSNELIKLAVMPLLFQNEALGYMAFDADDLGSCTAVSIRVAGALKAARLHQQVVELSLTDPLTGLQNRRYFDLLLKSEITRSRRFSRPLAVLLVDVDHLKTYNDMFGHQAADEALKLVAGCLSAGRRNADVVARIGGDEFALILPETDMIGARQVAGRIAAGVAALTDLKRPVTLSIGVAVLPQGDTSPEALISMADQALYASKRNGRNQVSIFDLSLNSRDVQPSA